MANLVDCAAGVAAGGTKAMVTTCAERQVTEVTWALSKRVVAEKIEQNA
jgi:hypothetical protein